MRNIFFVFTPLQLFVAQQIIRQERLEHCVLVGSVLDDNYHFSKIFDMMRIDDLWTKRLEFKDFARWNGDRVRSFKDIRYTYNNYKRIKKILEENSIDTIYLGEILNQACRFTDVVFHHQGYKIVFFEEGTSHYIDRPYHEDNRLSHKLKMWLLDTFYFRPFYGVKFAEWNSNPNCSYEKLPIDKRFSIIPFHHESFDVRLVIEPMFSDRLKRYVSSNIKADEHRVMLMTDPLRELMPQKYLYLYYDTIKEVLDQIIPGQVLYIKFHPREIESSRRKILDIAKESGKEYKVLSEEVNICVEYYLQVFHFEKIFFFNAITYFYNGYVFPKMEFVKLLPIVYKKCLETGLKGFVYMENMLKNIEHL